MNAPRRSNPSMPTVVFRADAGRRIGSGHVMRCLALAVPFIEGGWNVGLAATEETFSSVAALNAAAIDGLPLRGTAADEPPAMAARWPGGADILIVDHYHRDAVLEAASRGWAKRIVAIDDLADRRHDVDLLIDGAARTDAGYRPLLPKSARALVGPRYAIIHPSFRAARAAALHRRDGRPVERIVVSFGQVDAQNATSLALEALKAARFDGNIDVVLGGAAPHLPAVKSQVGARVRLHVNATNMAEILSAADLAIGAGGVSAWERCCLGLPSILLLIADNQRNITGEVAGVGAGIDMGEAAGVDPRRLAAAISELLADGEKRRSMSQAAARLVDGRAYERVFAAAIGPMIAGGRAISLRPAEASDEDWLFELQSAPQTRAFANDPNPPSRTGHHDWMRRTLDDDSRRLMIAECDGEPAGMLRLDRKASAYLVSIAVHPGRHRQGIGGAMLELAARMLPGRTLDAEVLTGNEASRAVFERAGYKRVGDTMFRRAAG